MNRTTWINCNLFSDAGNALTVALGLMLWVICIVAISWLGIRIMTGSARRRRGSKPGMHRPRRLRLGRREN